MKRLCRLILFLVVVVLLLKTPGSASARDIPSADELINKTIDARKQIKTYDIELVFDPDKTHVVPDMLRKRVRFDGERFRVDQERSYYESDRFEGLTQNSY